MTTIHYESARYKFWSKFYLSSIKLELYLSREFFFPLFLFFFLCWEINLSKMHVYFPLITNLKLFRMTNLTASRHFTESDATDEFLISVNASKKNKVSLILTWRALLRRNIPHFYWG